MFNSTPKKHAKGNHTKMPFLASQIGKIPNIWQHSWFTRVWRKTTRGNAWPYNPLEGAGQHTAKTQYKDPLTRGRLGIHPESKLAELWKDPCKTIHYSTNLNGNRRETTQMSSSNRLVNTLPHNHEGEACVAARKSKGYPCALPRRGLPNAVAWKMPKCRPVRWSLLRFF